MASTLTIDRLLTEDIFSLVGMQSLQDSDKEALLADMQHTVMLRAYALLLDNMTPEEQEALNAQSSENVEAFLADKGISLADVVAEESVRYRIELAHTFEKAANALADEPVAGALHAA